MTDASQERWVHVASTADVEAEEPIQVDVEGHKIALYRVDDNYYATDDLCTHEEASLADGFLDGTVIECPLHQGTFCIKTGKPLSPPVDTPVRTYDVKVDGDAIYVRYAAGA